MAHPITIIVLAFNEEANLPDLFTSLKDIKVNLFAVDSYSTDRTVELLEQNNFTVLQHPFKNYGVQRNWAQSNNPFKSPWVLHLDAGERLTSEFVEWLNNSFDPSKPVDGYIFSRRTMIFGNEVKHGGQYPQYHLRLFNPEKGRCEEKFYDQHFYVDGTTEVIKKHVDIIDTVMENWQTFTIGHARWAVFEAIEQIAKSGTDAGNVKASLFGSPIEQMRWWKTRVFQKTPPFLRALLFFIYRYFFRLGILDGMTGLAWHFLQGFWFRFLIDAVVLEFKTKMKKQGLTLDEIVEKEYGEKYSNLLKSIRMQNNTTHA